MKQARLLFLPKEYQWALDEYKITNKESIYDFYLRFNSVERKKILDYNLNLCYINVGRETFKKLGLPICKLDKTVDDIADVDRSSFSIELSNLYYSKAYRFGNGFIFCEYDETLETNVVEEVLPFKTSTLIHLILKAMTYDMSVKDVLNSEVWKLLNRHTFN